MAAKIYYATLKEPPPKGSLQELVLHLYILQEEYRQTEEIKLLVESILLAKDSNRSAEHIEEQWKRYHRARFPWAEKLAAQEKQDAQKALDEMVKEGAFKVIPVLPSQQNSSKLRPLRSLLIKEPNAASSKTLREPGTAMPPLQQSSGSRAKRRR